MLSVLDSSGFQILWFTRLTHSHYIGATSIYAFPSLIERGKLLLTKQTAWLSPDGQHSHGSPYLIALSVAIQSILNWILIIVIPFQRDPGWSRISLVAAKLSARPSYERYRH